MDTIKCAFDGCELMATKKRRFCAHHVYSLRRKYYEEYRQNETRKSHQTWYSMIQRCYNARHKSYSSYGGRGIKVCDRWRGPNGLENFRKDMGPRPKNRTLDRIDTEGDYCPENCRWATTRMQSCNKRTNTSNIGIYQRENGTWTARLSHNRKHLTMTFKTQEEAEAKRKEWEKLYP